MFAAEEVHFTQRCHLQIEAKHPAAGAATHLSRRGVVQEDLGMTAYAIGSLEAIHG